MPKLEYESLVQSLEDLASKTKVVEISADKRSLHHLETYSKEHAKYKAGVYIGDPHAEGSFNEYLQKKMQMDDPKYAEYVVVAEIKGDVGVYLDPLNDHLGGRKSFENIEIAKGVDLSGSILSNVRFNNSLSLSNVTLRDCVFNKVSFDGCDLKEADLRGVKLKNCQFKGYNGLEDPKLGSMNFDLFSPKEVRDSGLFDLEYTPETRLQKEAETTKKINQDKTKEVEEFVKEQKSKQSYYEWGKSFVANTQDYKLLMDKIDSGKKDIERKYNKRLKEELLEIKESYKIDLQKLSAQTDPTYIPLDKQYASSHKVVIKATQKDLIEYKTWVSDHKGSSFNEYLASRYSKSLQEAKDQYGDVRIIADFSKQEFRNFDFSGLNLSQVIFAHSTFNNCKFDKAELVGACFEKSVFKGKVSFQEADLTDANFITSSAEEIDFTSALMARVRMMHANYDKAVFEKALMYSADLTALQAAGAILREADITKGDLEKVNLRYADAQYAKLRKVNLTQALLDEADFSHADLTEAVLDQVDAQKAKFEEAIMEYAKAQNANFRGTMLKKIQARGIDLTDSDLEEVQAEYANFSKSLMDNVNARYATFEQAVFEDAHAHCADFTSTVMEGLKGERMDISSSILHETNLRNAGLKDSVMLEVDGYRAKLNGAILENANLEFARFITCDFNAAKLLNANLQGAHLAKADFEKADLTGAKIDQETILLDANFRQAIGAEKLKALKSDQEKVYSQWFGRSGYGHCSNNPDGSNDRFKCQRIGAAILSATIGGGAGYVYAGPLGGLAGSTLSVLLADKGMHTIKDAYYQDLGYLNNQIGDRLAELGAIAIATGAAGLDGAVKSTPAAVGICTGLGLITPDSVAMVLGGSVATYVGLKSLKNSVEEKSWWRGIASSALAGLGATTAYIGAARLSTGLYAYAGIVAWGSACYGYYGGKLAYDQMMDYSEEKETGMRPEQIYTTAQEEIKVSMERIAPTWQKAAFAVVFGVVGAGIAVATASLFIPTSGITGLLATTFITSNIAWSAGATSATIGYLFDQDIVKGIKKGMDYFNLKVKEYSASFDIESMEGYFIGKAEKMPSKEKSQSKEVHDPKTMARQNPEIHLVKDREQETIVQKQASKDSARSIG